MFSADVRRLLCVKGTRFGFDVVPEGWPDKSNVIVMRVDCGAGNIAPGREQRKTTGPAFRTGAQLDDVDTAFLGGCGCGRVHDGSDDQRLGFQVGEVVIEFAFTGTLDSAE